MTDQERSHPMTGMRAAHVVFVDDEPKVCASVRKTLKRAGADVHCFSCAQDCLRHLATAWCDLLITDVRMPGQDGMDLLAAVKERLPWIPVLIVTGYADVPLAVQALKAGAAEFVEKPLDRDTFLQTVERLDRAECPTGGLSGEVVDASGEADPVPRARRQEQPRDCRSSAPLTTNDRGPSSSRDAETGCRQHQRVIAAGGGPGAAPLRAGASRGGGGSRPVHRATPGQGANMRYGTRGLSVARCHCERSEAIPDAQRRCGLRRPMADVR